MNATLVDGFLAQARRRPDAVALTGDCEEVTYGTLLARATAQRGRVAGPGLAPGEPVGVLAVKSPATIALVLACLLERRPVLLPSPTLGQDVRARLTEAAGASRLLTARDDDRATAEPYGPAPARPDTTAFVLTTSGSTGVPKAVPLPAAAVDRFTAWAGDAFGIAEDTPVLNHAPLNFDLCLLDVWTTLARGGRVVLADPGRATRGTHLFGLLQRHRVEVVQAVPMFFRLLADAAPGRALPAVRHALTTGDALPAPLLAELPPLLPAARLHNVYGCTETNDSFVHEVVPARDTGPGPLPIGRPLPGVHALVVAEDGTVVDGEGRGELYVSTPFQSEGYLGAPAGPAFAPHPRGLPGRRYFRSGDLVHRAADGTFTLRGRTDFQVKVRGVRVNPQEVEAVLLAHPLVREAAVLALPDPVAGKLLHAVVRGDRGADGLDSLTLRGHLARGLPRAAIPSTVRVTADPLPRTSTGKVDRERVAQALLPA
ncbi:AMP-binding protein [Streptomyces sp. AC602_WCS936]|uniref:AMP-binding protein n=1 Tax=Streptomyces sp. AC602_WCS936 TaxID=2823685 RepID=UPI001C269040|nr:AMP-binding protein [Streptomyces sp. AC602_WCS936]